MAGSPPPGAPAPDASDRIPPDALLDGRYHVVRILGAGGFGRVYLAVDTRLGRDVAIKELRASRQKDRATYERYLERFQREARAGSSLRSENVVTVYDLHVDAAHNYYLVMEYVEGQDLSDLLAQVGVLPLERALAITLGIAHALDAIHEHDTVHRDIKPANILITRRGVAKLTDFGLAQVAHESQRSQIATRHPGTPVYMSPEQRVGYGYIDGRSDLYSLGLVLYEMLTGKRFGETGQPLHTMRPDLPPAVLAIVGQLLQEDRDARYPSARALAGDLARVVKQPDIPVSALSGLQPAPAPVAPPAPPAPPPMPQPGAPPAAMPAAPPVPPAPAPAARHGLRTALIAIGVVLGVLVLLALAVLLRPGGRRGESVATAPAVGGGAASAQATATPSERTGNGGAPTLAAPSPTVAATPTAVPMPTPRPQATAPAPTPAGGASGSAPSSVATALPAFATAAGGAPSPNATALPGFATASGGSGRPRTDPTATDAARRTDAAEGATPTRAGVVIWLDAQNSVQLALPRGWQIGVSRAIPGNALTLVSPDGTLFFLDIARTDADSAAEAIADRKLTHTQSTDFRFTDAAVTDLIIGGEPAKTMAYTYARRAQPNSATQAGQIWIVVHEGREFVFTADPIGPNRTVVEAIVASATFLDER